MGSIAVQQECLDIGNRMVFFRTLVDGKAFGDGYDADATDGVRHSSTMAQEDTLLLRVATSAYNSAMTGYSTEGVDSGNRAIRNGKVNFLDGVSEHDLTMLAMMAEVRVGSYRESVLSPGDHPSACFVLAKGVCSSRVPGHVGAVQTFQP